METSSTPAAAEQIGAPTKGPAFAGTWLLRQPYRDFHPRFLHAVERVSSWTTPERYDALAHLVPRAPCVALPRFVPESRELATRSESL